MKITCSECGSDIRVISVDTDGYFDLDVTAEPCQECLAQKQDDIEHLESELADAEHWEEDCLELEQQIKELESQ